MPSARVTFQNKSWRLMKLPVTNPPDDFIKATSGNQRGRLV